MSRNRLQDRLFRGKESAAPGVETDASGIRPKDPSPLNISIPRPPVMVPSQAPAPPKASKTEPSPKQPAPADPTTIPAADGRSYRERMIEHLGHRYIGVEKFRLQQDEDRERHWKRWGPYVSERQWVSCSLASRTLDLALNMSIIGNRP